MKQFFYAEIYRIILLIISPARFNELPSPEMYLRYVEARAEGGGGGVCLSERSHGNWEFSQNSGVRAGSMGFRCKFARLHLQVADWWREKSGLVQVELNDKPLNKIDLTACYSTS